MITTKFAALLAAAALAIGVIVGAAGALVADNALRPAPVTFDMGPGMMGGSYGYGMGPGMMGSGASSMYEWMRQYHGWTTPQSTP